MIDEEIAAQAPPDPWQALADARSYLEYLEHTGFVEVEPPPPGSREAASRGASRQAAPVGGGSADAASVGRGPGPGFSRPAERPALPGGGPTPAERAPESGTRGPRGGAGLGDLGPSSPPALTFSHRADGGNPFGPSAPPEVKFDRPPAPVGGYGPSAPPEVKFDRPPAPAGGYGPSAPPEVKFDRPPVPAGGYGPSAPPEVKGDRRADAVRPTEPLERAAGAPTRSEGESEGGSSRPPSLNELEGGLFAPRPAIREPVPVPRAQGEQPLPELPALRPEAGRVSLEDVQRFVGDCQRCGMHQRREALVFGAGNPTARVMLVAFAPSPEDAAASRPFAGEAGRLLDRILETMLELKREQVFVSHVVMCRTQDGRRPTGDEINTCLGLLHRQILAVNPWVIITLGERCSKKLLTSTETWDTLRGHWRRWRGLPVMPCWHPQELLKDDTLKRDMRDAMRDVKRVLAACRAREKASS